MNQYLGEIASLITAVCYATSSTFFTAAGKRFGAMVANRTRLVTAVLLLVMVHWIGLGEPLPLDAGAERWFWLGLSGIVGLALGDAFLFQAYVSIGPRMGLLLLSLAPAIAAILAWLFLNERLGPGKLLGMFVTLAGIIWVVLERKSNGHENGSIFSSLKDAHYRTGLLLGLGAATGQAVLAFGRSLAEIPSAHHRLLRAVDWLVNGSTEIVLAGATADGELELMNRVAAALEARFAM